MFVLPPRGAFTSPKGQRKGVAWCAAMAGMGVGLWVSAASALGATTGGQKSGPSGAIYSCIDAQGRRQTSDRPIPDCLDRGQRVLNKDGSERHVLPPRQTPQEQVAAEDARRQQLAAEQAQKDAIRRDRNLLMRYPNEAAHNKARQAALDDIRKAMASSEQRIADLKAERKPLLADAEFYKKKKSLPFKLRTALEGNQASQEAQADIIENHKAELVRINTNFDAELARLRRLWAGAVPGSVPDAPSKAQVLQVPQAASGL